MATARANNRAPASPLLDTVPDALQTNKGRVAVYGPASQLTNTMWLPTYACWHIVCAVGAAQYSKIYKLSIYLTDGKVWM